MPGAIGIMKRAYQALHPDQEITSAQFEKLMKDGKIYKDISCFNIKKNNPDWFSKKCKSCIKEYDKLRYSLNSEIIRERNKLFYDNNKDFDGRVISNINEFESYGVKIPDLEQKIYCCDPITIMSEVRLLIGNNKL